MNVLFIEDDRMNRRVVRDMLDVAGATMAEAERAEIGLDMIDRETYHMILIDLRMPGMDGITAIRHIRARADAKASQPKIKGWMTALGALGGGAGGAYMGAGIQKGDVFSGLTGIGKDSKKASTMTAERCTSLASAYTTESNGQNAQFYGNSLITAVENMDSGKTATANIASAREAINAAAQTTFKCEKVAQKDDNGNVVKDGSGNVVMIDKSGCTESSARTEAKTKANTEINNLANVCRQLVENGDTTTTDKKGLSTGAAAGIGAGVGAIAGGILGYTITDSIQQANLDSAERAAIDEFMNNVGSKIRCFIGGDEVGTYGDVISTSME